MRRLHRLAVAMAAVVLGAAGLAAPAAAAPGDPVHNQRTTLLASHPDTSNRSCFSTRIYLAAHNYARHVQVEGAASSTFHERLSGAIYLGAGNYTWTECLQGTSGNTYIHSDSLDPDNPAWNTSTWSYGFDLRYDDCHLCKYTWGGKLYWI